MALPTTASLPTVSWRRVVLGLACLFALSPAALVQAQPFAYITNQGSHDVSVIDLASQKVVATVPVGRSPAGVVASSRAGRVYVSNPDSKTISVIDMREQKVVGTLSAGDGPVGIDAAPDGSRLYAADWYRNRLLVFDTRPSAETPPAKARPWPASPSARRRPAWRPATGRAPCSSPSATTTAWRWST